jgi:hypothetical protein
MACGTKVPVDSAAFSSLALSAILAGQGFRYKEEDVVLFALPTTAGFGNWYVMVSKKGKEREVGAMAPQLVLARGEVSDREGRGEDMRLRPALRAYRNAPLAGGCFTHCRRHRSVPSQSTRLLEANRRGGFRSR